MLTVRYQYYTPGVSESAILSRVRNFMGGNFPYMQLISMPGDDRAVARFLAGKQPFAGG
jgi:hypothetical protein